MIDLRSDTLTKPSAAMLDAMHTASLGDDVYREDTDVLALEREVAKKLGKESALFVPSGTMANQIAMHLHTRPGDEVLVLRGAHVAHFELGGGASLSGLTLREVGSDVSLSLRELTECTETRSPLASPISLLCLENTLNRAGGLALPAEHTQSLFAIAKNAGWKTHLDGARLWNAHVATGTSLPELAHGTDSVSICFSKGLGAPIGSCLVGSAALIEAALRVRKRWGGAMRQAGPLARAALFALEHHLDELGRDHTLAAALRLALAQQLGDRFHFLPGDAQAATNMVVLAWSEGPRAGSVERDLARKGIRVHVWGETSLRLVLHRDVSGVDPNEIACTFRDVFSAQKW